MFPTTSETHKAANNNNDCRVHYAVSDTPHTPNVMATDNNYIHRNTPTSVATMTTNPHRCVGG